MSADTMPEAQQLIAEVIGEHRYSIVDSPVHRCVCGYDVGREDGAIDRHRAAEIDRALGGLRKFTAAGYLTAAGFLLAGGETTQYLQWVSGWTPEAVS